MKNKNEKFTTTNSRFYKRLVEMQTWSWYWICEGGDSWKDRSWKKYRKTKYKS